MNSKELLELAKKRRTYREFSQEPVDIEIIKDCIMIAATAPNGANKQPWHFVIVQSRHVKKELRALCEKVESEFYERRISDDWADDLSVLKTNSEKPFLEKAPYLIVVFKENYKILSDGKKNMNYYVTESTNIAIGFLISALHKMGLQSLTYTPAPMTFLRDYFNRPKGETPVMILAVGRGDPNYKLPPILKKNFEEIAEII